MFELHPPLSEREGRRVGAGFKTARPGDNIETRAHLRSAEGDQSGAQTSRRPGARYIHNTDTQILLDDFPIAAKRRVQLPCYLRRGAFLSPVDQRGAFRPAKRVYN